MRHGLMILSALLPGMVMAQGNGPGTATALSFTRSMSVPLNAVQLYDRASDALTWTFAKEPGGKILIADREAGVLEASARSNFRSAMLVGREETMGTIAYTVHVQVKAGELRAVVSAITHTGNRSTPRGGISVGTLMRDDNDVRPVSGLGRSNTVRLHTELRTSATERITTLLQAMEAHIRAHVDP